MKIITLLLSAFLCISVSNAQKKPPENQKSQRIERIINSQWTFNYFSDENAGKGYESPNYDDSNWPAISLPHSWNTYETTGELHPSVSNAEENDNPYWWIGWGWYRKHFLISRDYSDRKVFVEFEGVQKYCKVWINGKYCGEHNGGYGSFDFDLTQFIKPGEDNVLAVAVNNRHNEESEITPEGSANFNPYGGICHDVILVLKDKLYIPMQGSANHEGGTFITTPQTSEKEGIIRVQTWVKNDNPQKKSCTLQTSIVDVNNKIIQVIKTDVVINPGQMHKFDQTGKPIKNPHLWSNDNPYLYKVISEVIDEKKVADIYTSPFGFRWFRFDKEKNLLYVNSKEMIIRGGICHQEYPLLGNAIPKWIMEMDFLDMSGRLKYNFMKIMNYPNDKLVYDLADKYGIIIDEESPGTDVRNSSVGVREQHIKEMICRDRNHPGIMFWSIGNETYSSDVSKYILASDTTRKIIANSILNNSAADYLKEADQKNATDAQKITSGEPARIVLTGSHKKIDADRSSVAIITAGIVDSKGNTVSGATNTVRWNISGPATLAGPPIYESDIIEHNQIVGMGFTNLPVSNVIRSTGMPGKIHITVSASGLASGSFDIEADEMQHDNSILIEPVLDDKGRNPVARVVLNVNRLDDVPREINLTNNEFNLGPSDKKGFASVIRDYILKNNTRIDTASVEFKTLVDLLASHLANNNGHLIADDYNYNIEHYNNCRLISGYITSTKLPPLFKEALKKYYAIAIIKQGSEKNAGEEMNWLNWIPSGGTVVIVQNENTGSSLKGAIFTQHDKLADIISVVYPQFVKFSEEAKERALIFTSKVNPYVHAASTGNQNSGGDNLKKTNVSFIAEKGKPILIPLLKFISN